jgi:hypothetical protein
MVREPYDDDNDILITPIIDKLSSMVHKPL